MNKPLDTMLNELNAGIKSIQRGTTTSITSPVPVTIKAINPDKSMVLIDNQNIYIGNQSMQYEAVLSSLQSTTATFHASYVNGGSACMFGWQIIEFY